MYTYSKNSIAQRDFYKFYKETCERKGRDYVDYTTYSNILKDFNSLVRDKIIYEAERFKMPYRLGEIFIHKYRNDFREDNKRNWKVDWKKTRELGYKVYFESEFSYKWKWDKKKAVVKGKKFYTFKACKKARKMVPDAVNNKNIDYYH